MELFLNRKNKEAKLDHIKHKNKEESEICKEIDHDNFPIYKNLNMDIFLPYDIHKHNYKLNSITYEIYQSKYQEDMEFLLDILLY